MSLSKYDGLVFSHIFEAVWLTPIFSIIFIPKKNIVIRVEEMELIFEIQNLRGTDVKISDT